MLPTSLSAPKIFAASSVIACSARSLLSPHATDMAAWKGIRRTVSNPPLENANVTPAFSSSPAAWYVAAWNASSPGGSARTVADDDRHVGRLERRRARHRRRRARADDDVDVLALRPRDSLRDRRVASGADVERLLLVDDGQERFETPVLVARRIGAVDLACASSVSSSRSPELPAPPRRPPAGKPPPRPPPPPPGNENARPAAGRTTFSSHVQPSRFISGTSPPMMPPPGKMPADVMPSVRATAMASLSD